MKKAVAVIFLVLFPALCYAQPSIVFEEEVFDAGTVEAGSAIEHIYVFLNSGDQDLIIDKIIPS